MRGGAKEIGDVSMGVRGIVLAFQAVSGDELRGAERTDVAWSSEVAGQEAKRALDDVAMGLGMLGEAFGNRPPSPGRVPDHVDEVVGILGLTAVT